jgi:Tol biopolymer transport system component
MKLRSVLLFGALAASLAAQSNPPEGIVAYVREGRQIRLVAPDGTNDRLLWEHPPARQAPAIQGISSLAWHPAGHSLAFSSNHENAYSYYDYDLYTIGLKGTALHRLTNTPDRSELSKFPQGQVSVTIENRQVPSAAGAPSFRTTSFFFVYVNGAEKPKTVSVPPGGRETLVFPVAKITDGPQPVIAIGGLRRWPGASIRVQPGQTLPVTLVINGPGLKEFGAFGPVWSSDGARVAYRLGMCAGILSVPATPSPGTTIGKAVAGTGKNRPACVFDWAPAAVAGPPILFAGWLAESGQTDNSIYQTDEEGARLTRLVHFDAPSERIMAIQWMPDGSGFLFTRVESRGGADTSTNLYRYDFSTRTFVRMTRLQDDQHVRAFSVSPDGRRVVYEVGKLFYFPADADQPALRMIRIDGSQDRPLVANASSPAWGRTPAASHSSVPAGPAAR